MRQTKEAGTKPAHLKRSRKATKDLDERLGFALPGTAEWSVAWAGLEAVSGDQDREAYDELSGEVWQYMGAELHGGRWLHTFRHRWHPRMQKRWYLRVPATEGWTPPPWPSERPGSDLPDATTLPH